MTARFVYFLRPVGMDGPIKIGCSERPESRLATLMSWSPFRLEIITTVDGDFDLEQNIHQCFADLSTHGEWFRPEPRLTEAIRKIASGVPVAEAIDLTDVRGKLSRKPVGGASWSPETRRYMGMLARLRHAGKRAIAETGDKTRWCLPADAGHALDLIKMGAAKPRHLRRLEEVIASPADHFLTHSERYPEMRASPRPAVEMH